MSFKILMDILNSTLRILNSKGYFIRDPLNKDFYIQGIYYDSGDDELYFHAVEGEEVKANDTKDKTHDICISCRDPIS